MAINSPKRRMLRRSDTTSNSASSLLNSPAKKLTLTKSRSQPKIIRESSAGSLAL